MCLKSLWNVLRASNEPGNLVPLPSYIYGAFTNSVMTRRIREQSDLAVRVIGRCVGALIVNKLAADINSRNVPVSNDELACLSVILGFKSDDVMLLLSHPGAIEFMNVVSLAWVNIDSSASASVPSDVPDVFQQTFGILSQALPVELNATIQLNRTDTLMNVADGKCELVL